MADQDRPAENQQPTDQKPVETKKSKGYGKRPVWQWVVIYLIVAVIAYGIIYLVFIKGNGSTSSGY
ncbi:MAG TPA: hypothetical protein VLF79_02515 [Candidatus Saccharimonadales bacterium]|nr:hypothetical protein [Candidatus Saccharimonadales bacterium]